MSYVYRSPMYETFRTENKINKRVKKLKNFTSNCRSVNIALVLITGQIMVHY